MNAKRTVICSIFGHEWEMREQSEYRSKSSGFYSGKRCLRCGKKIKEANQFLPTGKLHFN
ncbi:MAG: hypothetical protein ABI855_11380 [Bacteroidota bacterium]